MSRRHKAPGLLACYRGRVSIQFEVHVRGKSEMANCTVLVIQNVATALFKYATSTNLERFVVSFL